MQGFFREHFQSAMRNLSFFLRVLLASVAFCDEWKHDLNMSFRTKCTTLQKRLFIRHATGINLRKASRNEQIVKAILKYLKKWAVVFLKK